MFQDMRTPIKLIIRDGDYAAALLLYGFLDVKGVLLELRRLATRGSGSLVLESLAARCLQSGRRFQPAAPLLDGQPPSITTVDAEVDPALPGVIFAQVFRREDDGRLIPACTGTVEGILEQSGFKTVNRQVRLTC